MVTQNQPLKLNSLVLTNIQGIHHVRIAADPLVNELVGKNRAGKTSVLQGILFGLAGERNIPKEPVRIGEEDGEIWMDTDEFVVSRKFTKDPDSGITKTTLRVKMDDSSAPAGQTFLNGILGRLTFNPLDFMTMEGTKQADIVKRLAGDEFVAQLRQFADDEQAAYDKRRDLKRVLKDLGQPIRVPAAEKISATDLLQEQKKIADYNTLQGQRMTAIKEVMTDIESTEEAIGELEKQIAEMQIKLKAENENLKFLNEKVGQLDKPEPLKSTEDIDAQIAAVDQDNAQATAYEKYLEHVEKVRAATKEVDEAEKEINTIRRNRNKAIKAAEIPIDGLSFTDDGITIDGKPLEQLSGQEQLELSVRIGMTLNPTLGIMLIQNGEQLDEEGMSQLIDLAEKYGRQLWIATVGDGHEAPRERGQQLIIEEGRIIPDVS